MGVALAVPQNPPPLLVRDDQENATFEPALDQTANTVPNPPNQKVILRDQGVLSFRSQGHHKTPIFR
jgi:hypothetical protein